MDPDGEIKQVADESDETMDDVEGHTFGPAVLGTILTSQHGRQRQPEKHGGDEALPPLTRPFPRMRDDKK